jgi:hypothetical protein
MHSSEEIKVGHRGLLLSVGLANLAVLPTFSVKSGPCGEEFDGVYFLDAPEIDCFLALNE